MNDYIVYSIPTSPDHWTHETDEVPAAFFERVEKEVAAYVAENWPGMEFETRRVPETMSYGNRSYSSLVEDNERDMLESIDNWLSGRWPDWLAEVYA